jgi:hypothetical protein
LQIESRFGDTESAESATNNGDAYRKSMDVAAVFEVGDRVYVSYLKSLNEIFKE